MVITPLMENKIYAEIEPGKSPPISTQNFTQYVSKLKPKFSKLSDPDMSCPNVYYTKHKSMFRPVMKQLLSRNNRYYIYDKDLADSREIDALEFNKYKVDCGIPADYQSINEFFLTTKPPSLAENSSSFSNSAYEDNFLHLPKKHPRISFVNGQFKLLRIQSEIGIKIDEKTCLSSLDITSQSSLATIIENPAYEMTQFDKLNLSDIDADIESQDTIDEIFLPPVDFLNSPNITNKLTISTKRKREDQDVNDDNSDEDFFKKFNGRSPYFQAPALCFKKLKSGLGKAVRKSLHFKNVDN